MSNVVPHLSDYRRLQMCIERGKNSVFAEMFRMTPEMSQMALEMNHGNRPLSEVSVRRYARQMETWPLTGSTLVFTKSAKMRDGQHRCAASVQSGHSFDTFVVFGVSDEAFAYMDTGKGRSAGDVLGIAGVGDANSTASACRWAYLIVNNIVQNSNMRPTNAEILEFAAAHQGIAESVTYCRDNNPLKLVRAGQLAALHYLFSRMDRALADKFIGHVMTGKSLDEGTMLTLHHRLSENLKAKRKILPVEMAALLIKSWNAIRDGKTIKTLKFARDEQFPLIK